MEDSTLCPSPNLLAKSRSHLKCLLRFVIACVFLERSPGQAIEDQEEPFRDHRRWPNEKLHPLPVPLKPSYRSTLSPIACHTKRPQTPAPPFSWRAGFCISFPPQMAKRCTWSMTNSTRSTTSRRYTPAFTGVTAEPNFLAFRSA